jgi:hypothetical protein
MIITKKGVKTTEFWMTIGTVLIPLIAKIAGVQIPNEAFAAIIAWVGARSAQKFFGVVDQKSGTPAWQTSEFWLTMIFAIAKSVLPDLPEEAFYGVLTGVGLRSAVKIQDKRATDQLPENTTTEIK